MFFYPFSLLQES